MTRGTGHAMLFVFLAAMLVPVGSIVYALTNLGSPLPAVYNPTVVSGEIPAGGPRVLYAPSESDDAGYRAAFAAQIGGTCDYFDARFATPTVEFLAGYDCVMTWANYAYFDNVEFGNNLADFVDMGGHVVLGAFAAYTSGNYLSGRLMTDTGRYCPVTGGFNHFSMSFWDGTCADGCVHQGIDGYGCTYRDYLTLVSGSVCGRFQDGEIANALNGWGDVVYANGAGGYPLFPSGQDAQRAGNACLCGAVTATEPVTWGAIKGLYR